MRPTLLALLALLVVQMPLAASNPGPAHGHYTGAGAVVVSAGGTLLDNGAVVCSDTHFESGDASGLGGVCIPWDQLGGDSVLVQDHDVGTQVAFQVCVDMNGDRVCGSASGPSVPECQDVIIFSHSSRGHGNFNPLFVNPSFVRPIWQSCGSQGFPGYVVISCAGVHDAAAGGTHTHTATGGVVSGTMTGGTPSGDFCGGPVAAKAYVAP